MTTNIGVDIGSQTIYSVILKDGQFSGHFLMPHQGNIPETIKQLISHISLQIPDTGRAALGITGNIGRDDISLIDSVLATVEAARWSGSRHRHILSVGCERSFLINMDEKGHYTGHSAQSDCAAGTGGFIDQQAYRLGVDPAGLAEMAQAYDGPVPTIATRCAVFAKSDIIHAQAAGYSPSGIAAGLCKGMARSIVASTTQGRELEGSLVFVGGVAKNRAIVRALSDLIEQEIEVPENGVFWNALGAALLAHRPFSDLFTLAENFGTKRHSRPALSTADMDYPDFSEDRMEIIDDVEVTAYASPESLKGNIYLGIDVGSTSTKAVVTDTGGRVMLGVYTRTRGNPVKAVSEILARIHEIYSTTYAGIAGVATTGSGRELIKSVFGADMAINEITAHAKGATFIDPEVDTIIEIGGQDSKFTRLRNSAVTLATMNYVCAAGTGSFIEEQAMRLDIALHEIPALTLGKNAPFTSDRCTVYMERDLNTLLAEGWDKAGTMAAVLFSVRDNYLSKVVGKTPIGKCVYFQGATARNKALVAAFAAELGTSVKVSKFCHLTGALGCAIALREAGLSASDFAGTDIIYSVAMEICELCTNKCDLSVYTVNGRKTAWGMKCGRDYNETARGKQKTFSDLEAAFRQIMRPEAEKEAGGPLVAIPQVVYMSEYGPLFESFLMNLGFRVKMAAGSEKSMAEGNRRIQADFCAPMAMVHGVVLNALQSDCDYVFFPTIISAPHESEDFIHPKPLSEKSEDRYFCYYSAYAPTILSSAAPSGQRSRLISPKISFFRRSTEDVAERLANDLKEIMPLDADHIKTAFMDAWKEFESRRHLWQHLGKEKQSAAKDKISIMLMARPYVLFDRGLNKGIPAKLESMGFDLLVQSMIRAPENPDSLQMHWHYGQQMMAALEVVAENPQIYPVFISCFRCSPDAYLMTEFKARMEKMGKPYLILQLDEHGSDVGYQTRIEAAAETFATHFASKSRIPANREIAKRIKTELKEGDTLLIPYTDGRINRLQAAVFRSAGYDARVMTLTPDQIHLGYRYASGGECLPNVAILGSMIDFMRKEMLDPEKTMLYLPSICLACNFPQYGALIMNGLEHAGLSGAGILTFNGLESVPGLSLRANVNILAAGNIGSLLHKLAFRFRPYETVPGTTDQALAEAEAAVIDHIMAGKSMISAAKAVREIVEKLPLPGKRKPRIAVLGDLYAKYNDVLNERVWDLAESLGGEILVPSYNEMLIHGIYSDALEKGMDTKSVATMVKFEQKFEAVFEGILDDQFEPTPEECHHLQQKYGMDQPIPGETAISIGRTLHYAEKGLVSAIIHVNPVFCCPGVVSSAIFKRLQEETGIPVIDLFYDGTNKPNTRIIPHLYYLTREKRAG
ncbi:MAG: hypothetical protein C4518_02785 [Desulfobacteraceae bacterium]|nr:MAG: hypothetical protein C4518_02785 [Desulfobacteraceae bacterium]